jgi:hypothetical protein
LSTSGLAGVLPEELLGQSDVHDDRVETAFDGEAHDVARIRGSRIVEEVTRAVL